MKILVKLLIAIFSVIFAIGCKGVNKENTIVIGATPVPQAEILEFIKPELKKMGYDLDIRAYTDYIIPNEALRDGSLDANFFQHLPYLQAFNQSRKSNLQSAGAVHIEPLSIFSIQIKSLSELKKGDIILIPNDPSNLARALILLDSLKVIKLKDPHNLGATQLDVVENPSKIEIRPIEAAMLADNINDKKVKAIVINGNYALQKGLKNPIAQENKESPYANIIAVQKKDRDNPKIKALLQVLQSQKTKDFILQHYQGKIIPAF